MKRLGLFIFTISFFYLFSSTQDLKSDSTLKDSLLIQKRNELVSDLRFYITGITDSSKKVLRKLILKLDTFLLKEDSLINLLQSAHTGKIQSLLQAQQNLKNEMEKPLEYYGYFEKYKYYAVGAAGALLLLWLIFMIAFFTKSASSRRRIKSMLPLVEKANSADEEIKKIQEELQLVKSELENKENSFKNEKTNLENQISVLTFERDELKQKVSRIPLLESEIQQLKTEQLKNSTILAETDNLKSEITKLKSDLQQLNDHYTALLAEKEQFIAALQGEITQIKKVKESLEKESNESDLRQLQEENSRLLKELEDLKRQISDALSWKTEYDRKQEENKLLSDEIRTYKEEIEKLKSQSYNVVSLEEYENLRKQLEEEKAFRKEAEEILKKFLKK